MCGGYELDVDLEAIISAFRVDRSQLELPLELPREHFPRMQGPIVLSHRDPSGQVVRMLGLSQWGLVPRWAQDPKIGDKLYNARAETLRDKPSFRESFARRRCVVPVTAFYEWRKDRPRSIRYAFRRLDGEVMALAGLWDLWRGPSGVRLGSFTVVTVPASSLVLPIHPRMPAVLSESQVATWLALEAEPETLAELLAPVSEEYLRAAPG